MKLLQKKKKKTFTNAVNTLILSLPGLHVVT